MTGFFFVACGGALGAAGRYAVSLLPVQAGFPVLTLVTNLLGAVLIGFVVGYGSAGGMTPNQILFWKTGVCGGFTTFSTFSLEALTCWRAAAWLRAGRTWRLVWGCAWAACCWAGRWASGRRHDIEKTADFRRPFFVSPGGLLLTFARKMSWGLGWKSGGDGGTMHFLQSPDGPLLTFSLESDIIPPVYSEEKEE